MLSHSYTSNPEGMADKKTGNVKSFLRISANFCVPLSNNIFVSFALFAFFRDEKKFKPFMGRHVDSSIFSRRYAQKYADMLSHSYTSNPEGVADKKTGNEKSFLRISANFCVPLPNNIFVFFDLSAFFRDKKIQTFYGSACRQQYFFTQICAEIRRYAEPFVHIKSRRGGRQKDLK